jgi:hypothetical protein
VTTTDLPRGTLWLTSKELIQEPQREAIQIIKVYQLHTEHESAQTDAALSVLFGRGHSGDANPRIRSE